MEKTLFMVINHEDLTSQKINACKDQMRLQGYNSFIVITPSEVKDFSNEIHQTFRFEGKKPQDILLIPRSRVMSNEMLSIIRIASENDGRIMYFSAFNGDMPGDQLRYVSENKVGRPSLGAFALLKMRIEDIVGTLLPTLPRAF